MRISRTLHQRAISMALAIAMVMGCTSGTAAADSSPSDNEATAPNTVTRTYDSGNVRLSNRIQQTDGAIKVQLKINISSISKFSEAAAAKDSGMEPESAEPSQTTVEPASSQAADGESGTSSVTMTAAVSARTTDVPEETEARQESAETPAGESLQKEEPAETPEQTPAEGPAKEAEQTAAEKPAEEPVQAPAQDRLYEVRFYIPGGYRAAEGSIPDDASLAEDGGYVSWPDLTAEKVQSFSGSVKLEPEEAEDGEALQSADAAEEAGDVSGIYGAASGTLLYAFGATEATPVVTVNKTVKLNDWDERTYDITLEAGSNQTTKPDPIDVVLVLDQSGSMPWLTKEPKTKVSIQDKDTLDVLNTSKTDNSDYGYNYEYYAYVNFGTYTHQEYEPIAYIGKKDIGSDSDPYIDGNGLYDEYGAGWYIIETNSSGKKYPIAYLSKKKNQKIKVSYKENGRFQSDDLDSIYQKTSEKTKQEQLQTATASFLGTLNSLSSDSKVAAVGFSTGAETKDFLIASQYSQIQNFVNGMIIKGGTQYNAGLQAAQTLFKNATIKNDGRKHYVVFFSDGKASDGTAFQSTVQAMKKDDGIIFYAAAIFGGSVQGSDKTAAENNLKAIANDPDSQYYFDASSDPGGLISAFQTILAQMTGSMTGTVTDYIDSRFVVLDASGDPITDHSQTATVEGGTVSYDTAKECWKIVWNSATIPPKNADGSYAWSKTITIQAKDDYIGGNNVATNAAGSGVTYTVSGTPTTVDFEQPRVNVKPDFSVGSDAATVFYGETAPNDVADGCKTWGPGSSVTYRWYKADGTTPIAAENADFPADLVPDGTTEYKLKAIAQFGTPTSASTAATEDHTAGDAANNYQLDATGTYTVNVVKGELDLTKIIDQKYPAPAAVNAKQSFVFKITRSDTKSGSAADMFCEVITPETVSSPGTMKKITGLKKGYYTVTEDTDAWRYTKTGTADNDSYGGGTTADGIVFIGRQTNEEEEPLAYFGAGEGYGVTTNPATVQFTNNLTNGHWLGDTTVAVNTISK